MAPTAYCYLDYYQSNNPGEPLSIGGYLPIDMVYRFEPVPDALSASEAKYILGTRGNLWTEYIPNFNRVSTWHFPHDRPHQKRCLVAESRKGLRGFFLCRLVST